MSFVDTRVYPILVHPIFFFFVNLEQPPPAPQPVKSKRGTRFEFC